jgi:hypothetical protein
VVLQFKFTPFLIRSTASGQFPFRAATNKAASSTLSSEINCYTFTLKIQVAMLFLVIVIYVGMKQGGERNNLYLTAEALSLS